LATRLTSAWQASRNTYRTVNRLTHHALGAAFKLALVLYFVFCGAVLGLRYVVLPHIDNYKPEVERLATHALGNKVTIQTIGASWSGLLPQLTLGNLVIHDKFGNDALTLPKVTATLSWWSVVAADLRLHSLLIERPDMDVVRDADGKLYVAGIHIDTAASGNGRGGDWVLSQHEIVIRDGRIRWNDASRAAPELALEKVDFVLRNEWRRHRFALKATPPAAFAAPLDLRASFEHPAFATRISDVSRWKGEIYADVRNTDLAVWKAYVDYPFELRQGKGSVRAWLNLDRSKVANFTADLELANVSTRLRKDLAPLNLVKVAGRVSVREEINQSNQDGMPTFGANGHAIALTDFSLQTDDGLFLPKTTISESFAPAKNGKPEKAEITARLLDLHALADLIERLPLPAAQRQMLVDFAPRGILRDFSVQWQGSYPELSAYKVMGRFEGLSIKAQPARPARPRSGKLPARAAVPAIPGVGNLTGSINASEKGGNLNLDSEQVKLDMAAYLPEAEVPFDRLALQASWHVQPNNQMVFDVQRMAFKQDELSGTLSGRHVLPLTGAGGKPRGSIDMVGTVDGFDIGRIGKYLPNEMPEGLRHWLSGALVAGTARDVRIHLKGDLAHFPFHPTAANEKPKGEFTVSGRIENAVLNYTPDVFGKDGKAPLWPLMEDINGTITFDRSRLEIHARSARSSNVAVADVKAVIPDLLHDPQLSIDGAATGALQDYLRFVNDSPVGGWIGKFTEESKGSGDAKLALKMHMPLGHPAEAKVQGTLQFMGNNVTLQNVIPPLAGANGKLDFNEKGFTIQNVKASFLGGPVTVSGGTQRDGNIFVTANGMLTADGVRRNYGMPSTQRATDRISGSARYTTSIRIRNKRPEIVVESNLQGVTLDFPAPLRKAANESLPLRFELASLPSTEATLMRDELKLSLGSAVAARYERQKGSDKDAEWHVVRGGIGVNAPAPLPDSGIIANVSVRSLDIDAWRRAVASLGMGQSSGETNKAQEALGIAQYIDPDVLAARATELILGGKKLDNVVVGASHQRGTWQANIDSEQAAGYVTWNQAPSGQGLGRVTARLASLTVPKSAASDVTDLLEGKNTTTELPAVDLIAENLELFGKKFGHTELQADNVRGATGREWRITKLLVLNSDGELRGSGKWTSNNGENISTLNYTLNITDAGRLLDRFGFANVLRGGKGKMEGSLSWKGQPFSFDIPSLSGQLTLDIASGQFLKADPGAGKLIGVLSLQALPRRLTLDFRDVFSQGIAFDGITANAMIKEGVVKTNNFKMRGVSATVLLDGMADIAKETQNLHVVVIPEINAGAASVVYGLAVNPFIGVGTFLAQLFLRDPLMKAFTFELQVTGPWKDPVVTKLQRNRPPTPAGEAAGGTQAKN
jgi:uncharacterized protein (TIGR02099 family)